MSDFPFLTSTIEPGDAVAGFSCGIHPLDEFFSRHAISNEAAGIGRTYVFRRRNEDDPSLPVILGYYTLSMALAETAKVAQVIEGKLPKYPMPVALLGRLAIDKRAQGRRYGELLLLDALKRILDASMILGCTGIIVDAKDESAERFYTRYGFVTITRDQWPRRQFLPIATV